MIIFSKLGDDLPYTPKTGTYFVGLAGLIGALFAPLTFLSLSRRANFIGAHIVFLICLAVIYAAIILNQPILLLVCIVILLIVFELMHFAVFWVYTAEICIDSAIGITLFVLMGSLIL